ncbi:hypothetical protein [Mycobacterium sp. OAS707]
MRGVRSAAVVSATVALVSSLGLAASAHASNYGVELSGSYRMIMNGDWAKTNEVFIDEQTQIQTWTLSSECTSPINCTGTVTSDQGWTAQMTNTGNYWVVVREIPNWEPCPDGTAVSGTQRFWMWGWDPIQSQLDPKFRDLLAGRVRTQAASGNCGINKPLVIEVPIRLEKLS